MNTTTSEVVTFEQFQEANDRHIHAVRTIMHKLSRMVQQAGENHDCTKKSQEKMFYRDFFNESDFAQSEWYQLHIQAERHHLSNNCPDDVNLIDILEMLSDVVCYGVESNEEIDKITISADILNKAVLNTAKEIRNLNTVHNKRGDKLI